jgi:hypothetical protein
MNPRQSQKALEVLQEVYGSLLERVVDAVIENEEGMRCTSYSFASQDVEDRFAPRVNALSHLIGALQNATARATCDEYRVETVLATAEELQEKVNEKFRTLRGARLQELSLQKMDDGRFLVMLTLSKSVPAVRRASNV